MNKKTLVTLTAIPVLASSLILSTGSTVFAQVQNQSVQEQKSLSTKKAELELYAKELSAYTYKLETYTDELINISNSDQFIQVSEKMVRYLQNEFPRSNSLKGNYNSEIIQLHEGYVLMVNKTISVYDKLLQLLNGEVADENIATVENEVTNALEEIENHSLTLDTLLANYMSKYNINTYNDYVAYLLGEADYPTTQVSTGATSVIVQKGDTLYSLSKKHGLTVNELKKLNNLKNNHLTVGQKIVVKGAIISTPATPQTGSSYEVAKGDTLYSIANKHGLTVNELKNLNGLKNNYLVVGQKIIVKKEIVSTPSTPQSSSTYKVVKSDTLYSVARKHNMTVNELKSLNKLKNDQLKIGQVLQVKKNANAVTPSPKPETNITTSKIVNVKTVLNVRHSTSANSKVIGSLKSNEKVDVYSIHGKWAKIKYKNGIGYVQVDYLKDAPVKPAPTGNTHIVQKGDTLYKISKTHKISVAELKKINNLKTESIVIGQSLKIKK